MRLAYISHPSFEQHEAGARHPESPDRVKAISKRLVASDLYPSLDFHTPPAADREQLLKVHTAEHIDRIYDIAPTQGYASLDGDTIMNPYSLEAALRAAGGSAHAVRLVLGDGPKSAFCAVRPPGHHAERDRAMGFCLFNNIAVGAAHALEAYGLARVAIVDFDVHHGNGTENIFSGDDRVLFCSSFQHPHYPGTGHGRTANNIVNVPLPAGTAGDRYHPAVETAWLERIADFQPQLLMFSAGFDAHRDDPLAGMNLREEDFARVTRACLKAATPSCAGRVVSTLEGGYNLDALAACVEAHVRALLDSAWP